MKTLLVIATAFALTGCGVETASTAATAASIKKQELQEGQKTMERAQQKIDGAMQQVQDRANSVEGKTEQ
jgi:NifU-like protein involved in Fe-S cluster formation